MTAAESLESRRRQRHTLDVRAIHARGLMGGDTAPRRPPSIIAGVTGLAIFFPAANGFFAGVRDAADVVERDPAGAFLVIAGEERVGLVHELGAAQLVIEISEIRILNMRSALRIASNSWASTKPS